MILTREQVEQQMQENLDSYGVVISLAALYKKLYGELPKIHLSGNQAEEANNFERMLP